MAELASPAPSYVHLSIVLGAVEETLTRKGAPAAAFHGLSSQVRCRRAHVSTRGTQPFHP